MMSFSPFKTKKTRDHPPVLPPSIGEDQINLRAYLGDGVFLKKDGSLGAIFLLKKGVYDEPLTEEALGYAFRKLNRFIASILTGIPEESANIVVQYICSQRDAKPFPKPSESSKEAILIKNEIDYVESLGLEIGRAHV